MSDAQSRRRFGRRALAVEFTIRDGTDRESGELTFDAADISEGGAFLRSELLLDTGTPLTVRFRLPGAAADYVVHAKVAWVSKGIDKALPGMGLAFVEVPPATRAAIAAFIKKA
jgi:uncharacterized protein (TIGR02266 family)